MVIEIMKLVCIDTSLDNIDFHLGSQLYEKMIWMKFCMLPKPVGLLKVLLFFFFFGGGGVQLVFKVRKLFLHDFMKYKFNICLCQKACGPICFKLGMMLDTTKLYCDSSLIDLTFSQGHSYGKTRTCAVIL